MAGSMHLATVVVPRRFRLRFFDIRVFKWLVPDWRCLALPLAVSRKRFLVDLCVFCFGIVAITYCDSWQLGKPAILKLSVETGKGD